MMNNTSTTARRPGANIKATRQLLTFLLQHISMKRPAILHNIRNNCTAFDDRTRSNSEQGKSQRVSHIEHHSDLCVQPRAFGLVSKLLSNLLETIETPERCRIGRECLDMSKSARRGSHNEGFNLYRTEQRVVL